MFRDLEIENLNIPTLIINQEKLDLDLKHFTDNDIVIVQSGTATGKTTQISKITKNLKEENKHYMLSIVNLISLSREQINTFHKDEIILCDYQTSINQFNNNDGVICINSISKLLTLEDYDLTNKILYIDECNDLIKSLTHNDRIETVVNASYTMLIKLIKNCKKIILTDATINLNTLNLLKTRTTNNKTIFIKNEVQKFKNVNAIKYLDENLFLEEVKSNIKNKKYFLFGCDGCEKITEFYLNLKNEFKDQEQDFLIFTGKQSERVKSADQFKNKYVFYSPTIKTGISFILKDIKQDHFMYYTKNPLCSPEDAYQMSCRTRNLNDLKYFMSEIKPIKMKHKSLEELETKYKNMIEINNRLLGLSVGRTENDEVHIVNNTFFKLFCYEHYKEEIFKTGWDIHYENRLRKDGFILSTVGKQKKINTSTNIIYKALLKENNETYFNDFKDKLYNIQNESDFDYITKQYKLLYARHNLLNIIDELSTEKYKIFLTDEYSLNNYFNLLNLFKTKQYIDNKIKMKKETSIDCLTITNTYNKIKLLEMFESHYKIERLDLSFTTLDNTNKISKDFQDLYKLLFPRQTSKSFSNKYDLKKLYVNIIKSICGDIPIITSKKERDGKNLIWDYSLNKDCIKDIILLAKMRNPILKHFSLILIKKLCDIEADKISSNKYITNINDESNDYENHLLNLTLKSDRVKISK